MAIESPRWFKSSYSSGGEQCIEIADLRRSSLAAVAVRDSKEPDGPALLVEPAAFAGFATFAATFEV
ncbi:DUF397 domain-containing protein [Streptomyces sp. NA04227]|uniref:DUF397 domain-containing protein n=1 Tax=Streptomyces sp. NA04227 TaxID=2742136 RepID=UPI001590BDF0|nr:DUF397 domain-containing protein [Streptomyces sp. NA04227]QKW08311.1 DUF397 domain-containing protein [Streptomyces sp. NA04227]